MRLCVKLVFYQVPLDANYKNVYDGYKTTEQYIDFLDTQIGSSYIFNRKEITLPATFPGGLQVKSAKDIDGRFRITLKNEDSISFHDYNYLLIYNGITGPSFATDPVFAFITSIESMNDAGSSAEVTLICQLDRWSNNYLRMKDTSFYDVNHVIRRHFEEVAYDPESVDPYYKTKGLITTEEEVPVKCTSFDFPNGGANNHRVLWAKVYLENECEYGQFNIGTHRSIVEKTAVSTHTTTPVVYCPVCVYSGFDVDYSIKTAWSSDTIPVMLRRMIRDTTIGASNYSEVIGLFFDSASVLKVDLTFYAPYNYTISGSHLNIDVKADLFSAGTYDPLVTAGAVYPNDSNDPISPDADDSWGSLSLYWLFRNISFSNNPTYAKKVYETFPAKQVGVDYLNGKPLTITRDEFEPRMRLFPFKYSSCMVNGKEFPLIPHYGNDYIYFYYKIKDEIDTKFKFGDIGEINSKEYISLKCNGQVITSIDSRDYFIRNNGTSLLYNGIASGVTEIGKGSANAGLTAASNLIRAIGQIRQADKLVDEYRLPSIDAFSDYKYGDYVYCRNYEILDQHWKDYYYNIIHKYGIAIDYETSLRVNYHTTFDYVRTSDCSLPFILNPTDRREIESAYNRGITRWHITPKSGDDTHYDTTKTSTAIRFFDKSVYNLDNVLYGKYL